MSHATIPSSVAAHAPRDAVMQSVSHVRARLARVFWLRVALQVMGCGIATWLLARFALRAASVPRDIALPLSAALSGVVAVVCGVLLRHRVGDVSPLRAALWIEERASTGFALVTWVERAVLDPAATSSAFAGVVAQAAAPSLAVAREALPRVARAQLMGPALFALGAGIVALLSSRAPQSALRDAMDRVRGAAGTERRRNVPIGAWRVRVVPPSYTRLPMRDLGDAATLRAISGTRIELVGTGAAPDSVRQRVLTDSATPTTALALDSAKEGWATHTVAADSPMELRVARDSFARLLLVEGIADSVPQVSLTQPLRDSVLRKPEGTLPLSAALHDDLGLASASFEVVVSSGEGERFTVKTTRVGARVFNGEHDVVLTAALSLGSMQLGPGDVVHLRAVARDAHPAASREAGVSETRSFRIARPSEYDSIAVEPAPPPEVDKSLLSQRMLLLLTERLDARRPKLAVDVLKDESRKLARDQSRLREAVGDAVFQRLTGEGGGEHSHSPGDGHDHGVEAVGGKLALSGVNAEGMLEEGDDSPVIAINKPLLEAYNAMWDAGRSLEQSDPHAAIPFMKVALAAIERARAASRLYLRGRPPTVIIDLAKIRMAGKDTGATNDRIARPALPPRAAAREARLLAAAALAARDAGAARDSLAVLRLEVLSDAPAFASALSSLVDALSSTGTIDLTAPFLRARRALGGIERVTVDEWSRGGRP